MHTSKPHTTLCNVPPGWPSETQCLAGRPALGNQDSNHWGVLSMAVPLKYGAGRWAQHLLTCSLHTEVGTCWGKGICFFKHLDAPPPAKDEHDNQTFPECFPEERCTPNGNCRFSSLLLIWAYAHSPSPTKSSKSQTPVWSWDVVLLFFSICASF